MTDPHDANQPLVRNGGSRPIPDPTELTDRAIARLERQLVERFESALAIRDTRIHAIEQATELRRIDVAGLHERLHDDITVAIAARSALVDEKFASVQIQFKERDIRAEREARDNKVAVDAAFAAQKEAAAKQDEANAKAIDKSERATSETIKTNQDSNKQTTDTLTKSLDEVKLEVRGISASKTGAVENRTSIYAVIGIVVSLILAGMAIITFALTRLS